MTTKEKQKPRFIRKKCTACTSCTDACPVDCIALQQDADSGDPNAYPYLSEEDACIGCGNCAEECPVDAVEMVA